MSTPLRAISATDMTERVLKCTANSDGTGTLNTILDTGDIEIGAVEIKDGTTDTRAVVGANGLSVSQNAATMPAATTMQNAVAANANGTSLAATGYAVAILNIVSSPAMSGGTTVNFEASVDDTTWVAILAHQVGVGGSLASTTTADGDFRINIAGYKSLRARISAYSAGTVTIKGYATPLSAQPTTVTIAGNPVLGAGSSVVGKVGIDQTTPGTTNLVALAANQSVNAAQINGVTPLMGNGVTGTGSQRVTIASDNTAFSVNSSPVAATTGGYSFLNIAAGQATTTVKSGAGTLHAIVLNSAATATNTTTIYDNTAASGTVIGRPAVTTATIPVTLIYELAFGTGLTIITATANGGDMTVIYK